MYFLFKKHTNKKQKKLKKKREKQKKPKKKRREKMWLLWIVSVEDLTWCHIVCEFALWTYVIESWISPGCSYEFKVVYVLQREKYTLSRMKMIYNLNFALLISLYNVFNEISWFYQDFNSENLCLNLYSVHATRILGLSLEIMLSRLKWRMKHLFNSEGYSLMSAQVVLYVFFESQIHQCFLRCASWV